MATTTHKTARKAAPAGAKTAAKKKTTTSASAVRAAPARSAKKPAAVKAEKKPVRAAGQTVKASTATRKPEPKRTAGKKTAAPAAAKKAAEAGQKKAGAEARSAGKKAVAAKAAAKKATSPPRAASTAKAKKAAEKAPAKATRGEANKATRTKKAPVPKPAAHAGNGHGTKKQAASGARRPGGAKAATIASREASPGHGTGGGLLSRRTRAPERRTEGYSDERWLTHQRKALEDERATYVEQARALRAEAEQLVEEMEPGDIQFDDESGEGGTVTVDRERDLALSAQALQAVDEIEHAVAKIDAGTYGICENCGRLIPKPRLEALPFARLCIDCKSGGLSRR